MLRHIAVRINIPRLTTRKIDFGIFPIGFILRAAKCTSRSKVHFARSSRANATAECAGSTTCNP